MKGVKSRNSSASTPERQQATWLKKWCGVTTDRIDQVIPQIRKSCVTRTHGERQSPLPAHLVLTDPSMECARKRGGLLSNVAKKTSRSKDEL